MISIVCVYNDRKILEKFLLKSLKDQNVAYDLILVDNTIGNFNSAAEALNYGAKKAKGKYIMFVHQDVELSSNSWLDELEKTLDELPNLGIAGVAGKKDEKGVMTVIKHGNPPQRAGSIAIKQPEKVQTLDECLIIIPKLIFDSVHFDEQTCNDWHLYAVDYCLSVVSLGYDSYVIPMFLYHRSTGRSMSKGYYSTLAKLLRKHKYRYRWIYTTMGNWSTIYPLKVQIILVTLRAWLSFELEKFGVKTLIKELFRKLKIM